MDTFTDLSDQQLGDQIVTWAGRVAAGEARLLALIAEFDRREAWGGPGLLSCAHWLTWRIGIGLGAARERVRVARRLRDLPAIAAALAAGQMSWSQVRAVTRVAAADDGIDWVDLARHSSGEQLERIVRGIRRVQVVEETEADPERAAHRMRTRTRYDEDGSLIITVRTNAEDGAVILAGLEAQRRELERQAADVPTAAGAEARDVPAGTPERPGPPSVSDADALLEMARAALDRERTEHPDVARRNRGRLAAQVDPLSGWGRLRDGEVLPPTSLRQVLRLLPGRGGPGRLRPLTAADLCRHDLGRTTRTPSLALRELLGTLDGERCRFPGCTRHRNLHAHHVVYWSDGGCTDLDNLVLVCSRHHTLIHERGFRLTLHPDRRLTVATPEGVPLLHHPDVPWGDPAALDRTARSDAANGTARMDLGYVVSVLLQQAA
jgi:hypothetical protein